MVDDKIAEDEEHDDREGDEKADEHRDVKLGERRFGKPEDQRRNGIDQDDEERDDPQRILRQLRGAAAKSIEIRNRCRWCIGHERNDVERTEPIARNNNHSKDRKKSGISQ